MITNVFMEGNRGLMEGVLNAVATCDVEAAYALSGLRSWDATIARIQAGWERLPLLLENLAWSWDQSDQVWRRNGSACMVKERAQ
jgi:hypothetical protein